MPSWWTPIVVKRKKALYPAPVPEPAPAPAPVAPSSPSSSSSSRSSSSSSSSSSSNTVAPSGPSQASIDAAKERARKRLELASRLKAEAEASRKVAQAKKDAIAQEQQQAFIGPVAPKTYSPTLSRTLSIRSILTSGDLTKEEKGIRMQSVLSSKPVMLTRGQIDKQGTVTYEDVYSSLSSSKRNVTSSIVSLSDPDTYYDPHQNVIIHDPVASRKAYNLKQTNIKIAELKTLQSSFDTSTESVKKAEEYKYDITLEEGGGYSFEPTAESKDIMKEEIISERVELLKDNYDMYSGSVGKRLVGYGHAITSGLLSWKDPLGFKSAIQSFSGDREGYFRTKAEASLDLDQAIDEGLGSYALKVGTGPWASVGMAFVGGAAIKAGASYATGYLTAKGISSAPALVKGVQAVAGIGMTGLVVKDVVETYQQKGMVEGTTKALTYGTLMGAGALGYSSVSGKGWYAKGEARWFGKHPDAPKLNWGVKGELIGTQSKITGFQSKGTPQEVTNINIRQTSAYKPQAKPSKPGFFDSWNPDKQMDYYGGIRSGTGKKQLHIRFPSSDSNFGSKFKATGFDAVTQRGVRFSDKGRTMTTSSDGVTSELGLADAKILAEGRGLRFWSYKSPQSGNRIFTVKKLSYMKTKDMTMNEMLGGGGIGQQLEPQILSQSVFTKNIIPTFTGASGTIPIMIPPVTVPSSELKLTGPVFTPPDVVSRYKPITVSPPVDDVVFDTQKDVKRTPISGTTFDDAMVFDDVQELGKVQKSSKIRDVVFDIPSITEQQTMFGYSPQPTKARAIEDVFFERTGGSAFKFPHFPTSLSGAGGTDFGWGYTTGITRKRKHRTGDILAELSKGFDF